MGRWTDYFDEEGALVYRRLLVLRTHLAPHAEKRPDALVPDDIAAEAMAVFAVMRRTMRREPGDRRFLEPASSLGWAALALRVGLAIEECNERIFTLEQLEGLRPMSYLRPDPDEDDDDEDAQEPDEGLDIDAIGARLSNMAKALEKG